MKFPCVNGDELNPAAPGEFQTRNRNAKPGRRSKTAIQLPLRMELPNYRKVNASHRLGSPAPDLLDELR